MSFLTIVSVTLIVKARRYMQQYPWQLRWLNGESSISIMVQIQRRAAKYFDRVYVERQYGHVLDISIDEITYGDLKVLS